MIGLDLGTTNCKAVALDADGRQLASASSDYRLYYPRSGWAEQQAGKVWQDVLGVRQAPAEAADASAVGAAMLGQWGR